ncbi:hypothetical protein [Pseudolactococcus piscium]|uniref:DUF4352 domain-containing protein n=1 Tax=Pseudolactococcus piscium MKFS47 TaxID=297352 RepID=A0A0D6DVH7_9LACT|nr:hypothetical protein [Lactococcus piscium]CEN27958.1 Uncharacterized protein LACPI_0758 [Lactococcus piscium MKFS47]
MKKAKLIGMLVLVVSILGACSSNEKKVSVSKEDKISKSSSKKETTPKEKETPKSEAGKRSNPVKFGETATIKETFKDDSFKPYNGKISISLSETKKGEEAWSLISQANQFNKPAPEGYEWILVKAKLSVTDLESEDVKYRVYNSFQPFDANGQSINQQNSFAVIPEPVFRGEIFKGGSVEGYFGFIAKPNEKVILEYKGNSADCYFSLN